MSDQTLPHEVDDGIDGGAQIEQVVPRLGALVACVDAGDLALATPCDGWTTRDLLNHVVGGAQMFADAFGGAPVRDISGRLPDVVGDDPHGAFERAVDAFGSAAQQPGAMDQVLPLPWGAMTGKTFLRFVAFDLLVHSWDLASTIDEDLDVPADLVVDVEAFAHRVLDPWPRDGVNFRAEATAPEGATPLERLVAYTGRTP